MYFHIVNAIPPLPSSFYGTAKFNGENVSEGTIIRALINGRVVAVSYTILNQGESVYAIDVPGDDPTTPEIEGGKEGDMIRFMLAGFLIRETATWQSGTNFAFDLTLTANATLPPPQPTDTPLPVNTATIEPTQTPTELPSPTPTTQPTQTTLSRPTQTPTTGQTVQMTATLMSTPTTEESPQATHTPPALTESHAAPLPTDVATDQPILEEPSETPIENDPDTTTRGWTLGIISLLLILVIAAGIFWVRRKRGKSDSGLLM